MIEYPNIENLPLITEYLLKDEPFGTPAPTLHILKGGGYGVSDWRPEISIPEPDEAGFLAAEPDAIAWRDGLVEALRIDQLKLYTEESGLRHGCGILDPLTGEPSGDSSAPIHVIRQQTGQARNHLVYLKLDGTEEQKVSANNCQEVEENLSLVVAQTIVAVQSGAITTEAEIDAAINAFDLAY